MILVKKNLKHFPLPFTKTQLIENIAIEIATRQGNIQIFSCYLPGGSINQHIQLNLSHDISSITRRRKTFFAVGDFNAKHRLWNNSRANTAGNIVYYLMQRNGFYVLNPPSHTHYHSDPRKNPSTIDIGLTNSLHAVSNLDSEPLGSDHNVVSFQVQLDQGVEVEHSHLRYRFQNANWEKYQRTIDGALDGFDFNHNNVTSIPEIDELVKKLTHTIQMGKRAAIPFALPDQYGLCLPPAIKEKISLCKIS